MKKFISLVLLVMTFSITALGCSPKKDISAEQTTQALYNLYVKADGEESKELGIFDEDIDSILESQKDNSISSARLSFVGSGLTITDEDLEEIYNLQVEALRKLTPTISIESETEEEIIINLSTNYVNATESTTKAAEDAIAKATESEITSRSEVSKLFIDNLLESLSSLEPSSETVEASFEFIKEKTTIDNKEIEIWIPKDSMSFAKELVSMTTGVEQ